MHDDVLVLFPGALGDFICFLPTLAALARSHPDGITLVAKPEWQALIDLPDATMVSIDRREIADLFTATRPARESTKALLGNRSLAYSWTGAGEPVFAERLAAVVPGHSRIYPFRGMAAGEHAVDYYARCAGVEPAPFARFLRLDTDWFAELRQRHDLIGRHLLVLHPGSGSVAKNWTGFPDLATRWAQRSDSGRIVVLRGPAELEIPAPKSIPGVLSLSDLTLSQVAALLKGCDLYAGNDSGISHLAGAVGAAGVVLFGATDPNVWAPRGDRLAVVHAPKECDRCEVNRLCTHRLPVKRVETILAI